MGILTARGYADYYGKPCKVYCRGCAVCDMWDDWQEMTGDVVKYESHDIECCACDSCTSIKETTEVN
jgi:hypothetical protein